MPQFNLLPGGIQEQYLDSRAKIQVFGGGFGNGKTTAAIIKVIMQCIADYPGSNGLIARATYPKLCDTVRKEFIKWMDPRLIDRFPLSTNSDNTCVLKDGTTVNFRYVAQQGKSAESSTSNLLSATFDWILVDQIEDPEISHKDFKDLLGRLRGQAVYRGDDPSMPRTGPRWLMLTTNPTRNWVYHELVRPLHQYQETGIISPKLLCYRNADGSPRLSKDGKPYLMIDLTEGSTLENKHNLPEDFYESLLSSYEGQMRDRYILGQWAAYEGLIYPQFNDQTHMVDESSIRIHLTNERKLSKVQWLESYDFGLIRPSCYLLAYVDSYSNIIVVDGFYLPETELREQYAIINGLRAKWGCNGTTIFGDPAIFRRTGKSLSHTIANDFWTEGRIAMRPADNDIGTGIAKVGSYLNIRNLRRNPFTLTVPAPSLYFNTELSFIPNEFAGYFWSRDKANKSKDEPAEGDDHAMDALKYLLTDRVNASELRAEATRKVPSWQRWHERDLESA